MIDELQYDESHNEKHWFKFIEFVAFSIQIEISY